MSGGRTVKIPLELFLKQKLLQMPPLLIMDTLLFPNSLPNNSMLRTLTLAQYIHKVESKEVSPHEVLSDITHAVAKENPTLNAYLALNKKVEEDMDQAVAK